MKNATSIPGWRVVAAAVFCLSTVAVAPLHAASMAPVAAEHGMVLTAQQLATRGGVDVLRRGGNAVDAAVAVGYALAVVYPAAGNLGGGGFMTAQLADGRKTFLDFREKAPLAATPDMYLDKDGNVIKGLSTNGHLAVGVPGTVSGLELARERYGTMSRAALIAPAIALADKGFTLDQGDIDMLATARQQDPDTIRAFEREYDAAVADRLAEDIVAGSSAATAGGGSGFNSPASQARGYDRKPANVDRKGSRRSSRKSTRNAQSTNSEASLSPRSQNLKRNRTSESVATVMKSGGKARKSQKTG